jgi:uncharacterized protein
MRGTGRPHAARIAACASLLGALLVPAPARAGLAEDIAYCQANVWPRFAGWSLSRQRGADEPRTAVDFYCLALGHWSGQAQFSPKDVARAAQYAKSAADQNHAGAQGLLGFFYSKGSGVRQDPAAAIAWWKKAAAQGHADSLNALAAAYDNGEGVPVDKAEALRLYRLAAEGGSKEARQVLAARDTPRAARPGQTEFDEGVRLYKAGQHAAAAKVFLRAAEMGNPRAQLQIGYQYNFGEGVPKNAAEAVKWYRRAADQGDATAQANLGGMYEDGAGVPEDWGEAARWYRKSAEQDNASGQFRLGRAYQFGIGVHQNRKLAVEWFQKASGNGNAQARYFAQHLLSRGNFIGFRNEQEEAYVIAGKLRTGLLWEEPVGVLFRGSGERLAYIKNLRHRVDRYEAYLAWVLRRNEYDDCTRSGRSYCSDPGPAPQ